MAFVFVAGEDEKIIHDVALLKHSDRIATGYGLSTDEKPTEGIPNGTRLYFMDWNSLTAEQKEASVSQLWMFDADNGVWHPQ